MDADIIVIGAGPVGLLAACELARDGVSVSVVDRLGERSDVPKGNGLVGQIVPALRRRGHLRGLTDVRGFPFAPVARGRGIRLAPVLLIPQRRLEALLAGRASELCVEVRRSFDVDDISQDGDGVVVSAGKTKLRARYAIGCDGARSTTRKHLGIAFVGFTSDNASSIARVVMSPDDARVVGRRLEVPGSPALILFRQNRTERGAVTVAPAHALDSSAPTDEYVLAVAEPRTTNDREDDPTIAELRASVLTVLGFELPIASAHSLGRNIPNSRQAARYRVGRVFLAGDAAHIFNAGGSALNVGMLDAIDLAARLVAVLRRGAPESRLDGYEPVRHKAGRKTLAQTRAQAARG